MSAKSVYATGLILNAANKHANDKVALRTGCLAALTFLEHQKIVPDKVLLPCVLGRAKKALTFK